MTYLRAIIAALRCLVVALEAILALIDQSNGSGGADRPVWRLSQLKSFSQNERTGGGLLTPPPFQYILAP